MPIVQELFADVFGSHIGKHSERLMYTKGKTVLAQAPLMHLEQVIVASRGVSISADAIAECCERGIPIFFLSSIGEPIATLSAPGLSGTVLTRRAQLTAYDDGRGAAISLAIADAKINNQAATLKYVAKSRKESDPELYDLLREASIETSVQADKLLGLRNMTLDDLRVYLMAFEANAATQYWGVLRNVIPEMYGWRARTTRGATDPVNSLLNYGYGILKTRVDNALHLAGLDSFAGFIHADRPGKPSLTLDMMEEFRSVAVDRLVIGLVNRRYTVEMTEQGRLQDDVRRSFAGKMKEHLQATVRYDGARFPIALVIQKQARRLAAYLRGETKRICHTKQNGDSTMRILLVYDIVNDRQRSKVADACLDYGLDRIQYSAFAGLLSRTHQEELMMRISHIIGDGAASVHLYPIDEKAWQKRLAFEQGMENLEIDDDVPQSADE